MIFYQLTIYNHNDAFIRQVKDKTKAQNIKILHEKKGYTVKVERMDDKQ